MYPFPSKIRRFTPSLPDPPPPAQISTSSLQEMKFSTALIALTSAVAFLASPTASESEVHLRVHLDKGICYTSCPSGQYCPNEEYPHKCRGPKSGECFNPATGAFQKGCSAGFKCNNGKCVYGKP
ncbi:hypothetical protein F443_09072 [Phytophthora nicotianae P1569]|uniref:Uncharacterized protein n=2 Tax=Phytophthora nicotianae TaxID=4792 RepID=V9F4R3_PHYNI|nr:hypothetical protein F443_09072 [Phytophthora nicotianae P1569]